MAVPPFPVPKRSMSQAELDAKLRAAAAWGVDSEVSSLLRAGADPASQAPTAEQATIMAPGAAKAASLIVDAADNAPMAAARNGRSKALEILASTNRIWFTPQGQQIRGAYGHDYATAAVASKAPTGHECVELLWRIQPGMFLAECLDEVDGALRQACKSGNAGALEYLASSMSGHPTLGQRGPGLVARAISRRGRTGRNGLLWALRSGVEAASATALRWSGGAALDMVGADGRGAWHCAAESADWRIALQCAQWVDSGVWPMGRERIALRDASGRSAMDLAAAHGDLQTVKALWKCALDADRHGLSKTASKEAEQAAKPHVLAWLKSKGGSLAPAPETPIKEDPAKKAMQGMAASASQARERAKASMAAIRQDAPVKTPPSNSARR